ncbi:TonB-dependent receptor plug domain-containing protein [Pseudopontixanthobacter vadosimaris]|uniref:TonB-dependent receptor plug domain-containing protein n=1 Tax=Pseudopontixanthobacter vadosimaris TaxID=2726450 RepID=UPI001474DAE1|nr:TonB-dependent receptor [Pseudopontixanthobacter vadosimaris]
MRNSLYILLSASAIAVAAPALAQDLPTGAEHGGSTAEELIVIGTGLPDAADRTGQAITVLDEEVLDSIQSPDLSRALRRLPGVTLTRNGGLGGFTGVRVRGSAAEQVLVLIDGVRVNDVSSPGGGYDFGGLMGGTIERIELLRGSSSVIWGSDALGGVMNLTTRRAAGLEADAEYGGDDRFSGNLAYGIENGALSAAFGGGYVTEEGFSSAASGTEADGFRQYDATARADIALGGGLSLNAAGRFADSELEIDGFPAPAFTFADTLERQDQREISSRFGADYTGDDLTVRGGIALADISRDLVDEGVGPEPYYATDGQSVRAEIFGRVRLPGTFALDFGGDYEWTDFRADDGFAATDGSAELRSVHALFGHYGSRLTLAGGVRYDDHSRFGGEWSLGANAAYALAPDLRIRASYGEGFKVPTLFQLLSDFGNDALQPERSKSYDAGLEYGARDDAFFAAVTAFRRDSDNLIDFVSCFGSPSPICTGRPFGTYDNIGRARAQGVEVEGSVAPDANTRFGLVYSYIDTENRTADGSASGNQLARRPAHALTASADWQTPFGVVLGGDIRLVGDSFDDAGNLVPIDGYALADIRASLPFGDRFELFGRIENVTDADYVEVAGYATQGRAAYVGARLRM